jgi:hypothetical protein
LGIYSVKFQNFPSPKNLAPLARAYRKVRPCEPAKLTIRSQKIAQHQAQWNYRPSPTILPKKSWAKDFWVSFNLEFIFWIIRKNLGIFQAVFSHSDWGPRKLTPSNLKCSKKNWKFLTHIEAFRRWENRENFIENTFCD